jgi:hypothetical protein
MSARRGASTQAEDREHGPDATVRPEEEEPGAGRHERGDAEDGHEENEVAEGVHATFGLSLGAARPREADGDRRGRDERGDDVPAHHDADLGE